MASDDRTERIVKLETRGCVTAMSRKQKADGFALDLATWRAHIAAPGSRFESEQSASARIVRLDAVSGAAVSSEAERRTA